MSDRFQNTAQPDRDWWEQLWPGPERVVERLGVEPGDRVVDVCAGDGLFTLALAERTDGAVYAVDIDAGLLASVSERAGERGLAVETIRADARDLGDALPVPVEFALLANTFHGISEQEAFAETVREVLTDDGRFAVVNWRDRPRAETTVLGEERGPPTERRMSAEATLEVCAAAGFTLDEVVDLPPYHYGAVFRPEP
ncbi:class I SAM-dependent methyltransferase [Halolamina salifodinae]|uniref:Cyclopropane fatty-acyl-phospholipid synthase-like methyltransferase n=1 Tax=Halolamina salifodinae TaxID=1202767 RepID=A0A8T4GZT9_9EURY|nr:class I SAM-dependent methyltransferase [Halolamina salifodinae]MBP1986865.1 cyclopropane fatty-acyl-phospholipid synthase-like methyltransferase [Halolamina salifodinae]